MKIAIAGIGYVGLSNAVVLAQRHEVRAIDLDAGRVEMVNRRESPVEDVETSDHDCPQSWARTAEWMAL